MDGGTNGGGAALQAGQVAVTQEHRSPHWPSLFTPCLGLRVRRLRFRRSRCSRCIPPWLLPPHPPHDPPSLGDAWQLKALQQQGLLNLPAAGMDGFGSGGMPGMGMGVPGAGIGMAGVAVGMPGMGMFMPGVGGVTSGIGGTHGFGPRPQPQPLPKGVPPPPGVGGWPAGADGDGELAFADFMSARSCVLPFCYHQWWMASHPTHLPSCHLAGAFRSEMKEARGQDSRMDKMVTCASLTTPCTLPASLHVCAVHLCARSDRVSAVTPCAHHVAYCKSNVLSSPSG